MDLILVPGRPVLLVGALGALLALIPAAASAVGLDTAGLLEACRAIMGGLAGVMPCAAGR